LQGSFEQYFFVRKDTDSRCDAIFPRNMQPDPCTHSVHSMLGTQAVDAGGAYFAASASASPGFFLKA